VLQTVRHHFNIYASITVLLCRDEGNSLHAST